MKKEQSNIPLIAMNPMFGILTFHWFIYYLGKSIPKDKLNLYIIHNNNHRSHKKKYGTFSADFNKKIIINLLSNVSGVLLLGDYENARFFLLSNKSIGDKLLEIGKSNEYDLTIGVTASLDNDNQFSIVDRTIKALNLAQQKQIHIQKL